MNEVKVVGVDPSLTGTGVALVWEGTPIVQTFTSAGKKDDDLWCRQKRLQGLWMKTYEFVYNNDPALVLIERPAFAKVGGHNHDRSGLWWLLVYQLILEKYNVLEISPTSRAKYATGKGTSSKEAVLLDTVRRYPEVPIKNNNEADALILAMMGTRLLDHPYEQTLPKTHLDAMNILRLPEGFNA